MGTIRRTLKAAKKQPGKTDAARLKSAREQLRRAAQADPDCPTLSEEEAAEMRPANTDLTAEESPDDQKN